MTGEPPAFDFIRDYVGALDARGRLLRMGTMDQDRYEATGFAYRLYERFGREFAPAFVIEGVRIGGRWIDGPVVGNLYGSDPTALGKNLAHLAQQPSPPVAAPPQARAGGGSTADGASSLRNSGFILPIHAFFKNRRDIHSCAPELRRQFTRLCRYVAA